MICGIKLKSSLLLLVLLCFSFSAYSQESEPLTAEELQGLPEATLIEIILKYDSSSIATEKDLSQIKSDWNSEKELLSQDRQRLTERETALEIHEGLFGKSLELQEKEKSRNLIEKIAIGTGCTIVGAGIGAVVVIVTLLTSDNFQVYFAQ